MTRKNFVSDQEVRWCPGCGDYAILAQIQKVLPGLGIPRENIVFISGIGCSSRFPYYMNTYGIHSIHGRAPTLATGLKVANPELSVWVVTGDGDGLSIGGNHLLHCLRRNVDINILLFNNRIYGLTKGQYSPTSLPGHKTKTSPLGTVEQSFNPLCVAIGAEATFVARSVDRDTHHLAETLRRAAEHRGTSFVEIYQNCNIFNDGAWSHITSPSTKDDSTLLLEHGKPMVFGKGLNKGIRSSGLTPEVVTLGNGIGEEDLLVHDEEAEQPALAYFLSRMEHPDFPVPLGVFRCVDHPSYERQILEQEAAVEEQRGEGDLVSLYNAADTWIVPEDGLVNIPGEDAREPDEVSLVEGTPMVPGIDHDVARTAFHHLMTDPVSQLDLLVPECVSRNTSVREAIDRMIEKNIGYVLVTNKDGRLVGIFAEGDVFTKIAGQNVDTENTPIESVMSRNPTTLKASAHIAHFVHLTALHGYRHIPIVDDARRPIKVASFRRGLKFIGDLYSGGGQ